MAIAQWNTLSQPNMFYHSTCIAAKEADDIASGFMDCNTLRWMRITPSWYIVDAVCNILNSSTLTRNDMH